jgi:hypothetical protein
MAWTQDEADSFLKTFSAVEKRNKPSEADLKEQRRLQRQQELLDAAKAEDAAKANEKNLFQQAGDVVGAVGNFAKDAVISVKDDAVNAYTGIKDTIEGSVAASENLKDSEKYRAEQKAISDKLFAITGDKTDDATWNQPEVKALQNQLNKLALENGQGGGLTDEQKAAAGADQTKIDTKKKVSGDRQKQFDESQKVDALKTAGAAASTFLNVATLGSGTAVKAGGKQAITQAVKAGGKEAAKEVAKRVALAGAEGAVFGGAGGAASAAARGEDVLTGAAQGAAFGGVVGGAVGGVTGRSIAKKAGKAEAAAAKVASQADAAVKTVDGGIDNLATELSTDAKLKTLGDEATAADMAGRKAEFDQIQGNRMIGLTDNGAAPASNGQKLLEAGTPARDIAQVDAEITKMQTEGAGNLTPDEARAKFSALREERKIALENDAQRGFTLERQDARAQFEKNGLPNDPVEAQAMLDNFDNGKVDLPTTQDTPVTGAQDIFAHENMPVELKSAASELLDDRKVVDSELSKLTTPEKATTEQAAMDDAYKAQQAEIEQMPLPRQEIEQAKLDEQYTKDLQELRDRFDKDAPKVSEITRISEHLTNKEQELVRQSNMLMDTAPDQFRSVDNAEFMARRTAMADNLDTAKRFNDPEAIVDDVSSSPRPETVVDAEPDVRQAYQAKAMDETANIVGVKNIGGVREALLNFTSPSKNIKALTGSDEIFSGIIRAESAVNQANKADINIISEISKRIKGKEQASQIIDFIEGKRSTLSGFDEETAGLVREFFDTKRAGLKDLGYDTLDEYFPHLFNKNDPNVKRLFKGKTTADINFGNLKHRLEEGGDYNRDIVEVMAAYARGYNRKTLLEPAIKPLEDIKMQTEASKAVGDWVDGYIENLKGITEPSGAEKAFNGIVDAALGKAGKTTGGNHYRQTLGAQRMISAVATMGLNPGTAIRNMTQVVNTVAGIGAKNATRGAIQATRAFAAGKNSPEWKEMIASGIFDGGISRHFQVDLDSELGRLNKAQNIGEKGANFMMGMIRGTDVSLRAQAYWGAKNAGIEEAIAKGLKGEAAEKFAKDFAIKKVADTQFITSAADIPVKLNGAGVRSLTQLATFSIKQAEMLGELGIKTFKRPDGTIGINYKQAGNLLAAGVTAALFTEALKPVIGFNEKEWIPFYDQVAGIVDPNSTAGESLYRSPLVSLIAGNGKGKIGLLDGIKSGKMDEFLNDNWSQIVPAGTQIKKTVEGLQTTTEGISKNPKGKVRFLQDMGIDNQLKASLFGQYSTDAGRQWIKDGFPTLTDSEMRLGSKEGSGDITFEELPRETQKEFYDYYAQTKKVTGKNDALDKIKEAVRDGNIKKAQRLGDEYNSKATEAMKGYFAKHKELPPELQDEMTSKLFIDVQGKIDDALDEE